MNTTVHARPGFVGRLRSRQAGLPSGLLGRVVGRVMVKDTAEANDRALALLDLREARTVLEVGFAQGRTAQLLLRGGHRVIGVDASPTMVKQATARNRAACRDGRATLRHGDGTTTAFPNGSAGSAVTVHTIYFMPDPATTIAEIVRVLRPGGQLVIACRTGDVPMPAWMDPDVYRIPTATEIIDMLHNAGSRNVDHHPGDSTNHDTHLFDARLAS